MALRVVVVGGGVGGLASALAFARAGHRVAVLERDGAPPSQDSDEAFASWDRPGVPHVRQGHLVLARAVGLLRELAPDVLEDVAGRGADLLPNPLPAELQDPVDEGADLLSCRRIPFELALRRAVEAEGDVELRTGTAGTGLLVEDGVVPRLRGVTTPSAEVYADVVVDAGGRRSPVRRWLAEAGVVLPEATDSDCDLVYYGRYLAAGDGETDGWALLATRASLDSCWFGCFPGDRGTYGLVFGVPPWDRDLRALRFDTAWEALARAIPAVAPLVDPARARFLEGVRVMSGMRNRLQPFATAEHPAVTGYLPVGDTFCETDPTPAWGLSLAIHQAVAAVAAVDECGDDLDAVALHYAAAVTPEAAACVGAVTAMGAVRSAGWRGERLDESDPDIMREYLFLEGVLPAAFEDPVLMRATARRFHLLEPPDAIFEDVDVLRRATQVRRARTGTSTVAEGPSRSEVVGVLRSAAAHPA